VAQLRGYDAGVWPIGSFAHGDPDGASDIDVAVERERRASPGAVIRASRAGGLVADKTAEALLALAEDRNRAVQVYYKELAQALARRQPARTPAHACSRARRRLCRRP
jgi:predicted nucleotidyltransferase